MFWSLFGPSSGCYINVSTVKVKVYTKSSVTHVYVAETQGIYVYAGILYQNIS